MVKHALTTEPDYPALDYILDDHGTQVMTFADYDESYEGRRQYAAHRRLTPNVSAAEIIKLSGEYVHTGFECGAI